MQQLSLLDNCLTFADKFIKSMLGHYGQSKRESPAKNMTDIDLTSDEKAKVIRLMRINHVGEVCAQALYQGQALTTRDPRLQKKFSQAAEEEIDHLYWCAERLQELNGRSSFLNPLWYVGSLIMGASVGLAGDRWSLGFLAETEKQVENHLSLHLNQLAKEDQKTRVILETMRTEEINHATTAWQEGAYPLPKLIKQSMRFSAKIMTTIAYYV